MWFMGGNMKDIYSKPFDCPLLEIPYIAMAKELDSGFDAKTYLYYNYLLDLLKINKVVWGYIRSRYEVVLRSYAFYKLFINIKDKGFKDSDVIEYINGLPYGKLTFIKEDGKIQLIDGHHRMAILIHLGYSEFEVKENYLIPI